MMKRIFAVAALATVLLSCGSKEDVKVEPAAPQKLPYLGTKEYVYAEDGSIKDSIPLTIPPFSFTDQDGKTVTEKTVDGKIYIADFFFTSCPSICPVMAGNLSLVQDEFKDNPDIMILSHSIDPEYDTPEVLKKYAEEKGADTKFWTFVTGNKDSIYDICENYYMGYAKEDAREEGGYVHSGFLILVDKNRHVRGAYDGTNQGKTEDLIRDVKILLKEG